MTSYITCFPLTAFRGRGSREQKANKANIWHQRARTEVSPRDEPWPRGERPRGPTTHTGRYAKRPPPPTVALLPLCKIPTGHRAAECGLTKKHAQKLQFSIGKNRIFFPETRDQKVTLLLCCNAIIFDIFLSCSKNFPRQQNVFLLVLIQDFLTFPACF